MSEFVLRSLFENYSSSCRWYGVFCILLAGFSTNLLSQDIEQFSSVIFEESKLRINGTSNVTDFECVYQDRVSANSLSHTVTFGDSDSLIINGDVVQIRSESFDCGKRPINRDMMKTLKADKYPYIYLGLDAIEISDELPFELRINVTLAGMNRSEKIVVNGFSYEDGLTTISGVSYLDLRDYSLETPSPLFGLIKVADEVEIAFTFKIRTTKKG